MNTPELNDTPTTAANSTRLLAVGVLVVVLAAGLLGGVALDRTVLRQHRWERSERSERRTPRRPSDMLGADLKLSEDQASRIDTLIERQMSGFREIRKRSQPAIDSLMTQTRSAIDSILTPTQRAQMDSARTRREAEFKKRFPNGAPPMGPGGWNRGPRGN